MPWVRFDDQYPIHRKVDGLTDAAFRLHTSAIFWCARNLMDGFVPEEDLDGVTARVRTPSRFAAECVRRGPWHLARTPCPSESEKCPPPVDADGWRIHDYWEYQPSKAQVLKERKENAKRQKKWRERNAVSNAVTDPVDNPENGSGQSPGSNRYRSGVVPPSDRNAVSNAVSNGVSNSAPTRPYIDTGPAEREPFLRAREDKGKFGEVKSNGPASRHPSARSMDEAERIAGVPPDNRPASDETIAAAAALARQAFNGRTT